MGRILILIDHSRNRDLMLQALRPRYDVIPAGDEAALEAPCDLVVLDGTALERTLPKLKALREAHAPVFLPFLLVTSRKDVRYITREIWQVVDELILTPIDRVELQARVEILLRARRMSQRLQEMEKRALEEVESKFRSLVEQTLMGVVVVGQQMRILFANQAFAEICGYSVEELLGLPPSRVEALVHPQDRPVVWGLFSRRARGELPPQSYEFRGITKDGGERWLLMHTSAINYEGKRAVQGAVIDITSRREAQQELERSREELRSLLARMREMEEEQRRALARELHDQVGQDLTALSIHLDLIRAKALRGDAKDLPEHADRALEVVKRTVQRIRDVMAELRPPILDDYGLYAALRWYGERFASLTGISVEAVGGDLPHRLSSFAATALFRIAQEALTNVAKHAGASRVVLELKQKRGRTTLRIQDDGKGYDPEKAAMGSKVGWGILGMRERAASVGAHLVIRGRPGKGTEVLVSLGGRR